MAEWKDVESYIVCQGITEVSAKAKLPMLTVVQAQDKAGTLGMGEFIYAEGLDATVAGSVVTIDEAGVTALAVADAVGKVGVAMAATVSGKYGWYQISGKAAAKVATGFIDGKACFLTATAGTIDDAVVAGDLIDGMIGRSAIGTPSAGMAYLELNRPLADNVTET
jgi:hypothetical protein